MTVSISKMMTTQINHTNMTDMTDKQIESREQTYNEVREAMKELNEIRRSLNSYARTLKTMKDNLACIDKSHTITANSINAFIKSCVTENAHIYTPHGTTYSVYLQFCNDRKIPAESSKALSIALQEYGYKRGRKVGQRVWLGCNISLSPIIDAPAPYISPVITPSPEPTRAIISEIPTPTTRHFCTCGHPAPSHKSKGFLCTIPGCTCTGYKDTI